MPDRRALAAALDSQEVAVATACAQRRHRPSSLIPTPLPFKRGVPPRGRRGAGYLPFAIMEPCSPPSLEGEGGFSACRAFHTREGKVRVVAARRSSGEHDTRQ